jgi:alpha-amylase/alpha-mannosidase (GH57 family)
MTDTFKVVNYIDPQELKKDLTYTPNALTDAMMAQASMFAHYGVLAAKASKQVNTFEFLLETTEAKVHRKLRDAAVAAGEKYTEAGLSKDIMRDPGILKIKRALNEAKQIEAVAKTAVESFRHRRDMLVQHGLISREEMKGEISIAARNIREQEAENTKNRIMEMRKKTASE